MPSFMHLCVVFLTLLCTIGLPQLSNANTQLTPFQIDNNGRLVLSNTTPLSEFKLPTDAEQFFNNNNAYEYGATLYIQNVGEADKTEGYTLYRQRAYNEIESVLGHTPQWGRWADDIKEQVNADGGIEIAGQLTHNGIQTTGDYLGHAVFRTIGDYSHTSTKNHAFSEILPEIHVHNQFINQLESTVNLSPAEHAKLVQDHLYQSTQAQPNEYRAPYIFDPKYRNYATDGEYWGREAEHTVCGGYTYYGVNGSKICRSTPMSLAERMQQGIDSVSQDLGNHLDKVWQDTIDKARQDSNQMTAGADAPQGFNVFGWTSYHANGIFSATTTIPSGVIRTAGIDTAISNAYNDHAPDTLKQTVSNTAQKYNDWAANNPNLAQTTQLSANVGATALGIRAGLPKGVGRGSDDFGTTTTNHADDAFARAGDYDLGNVYEGNPNEPAVRRLQDKKLNDIGLGVRNPHYDTKHAYYTSLQEQYDRAMHGTNPQTGKSGNPVNASKFFNAPDMEYALNEAERLYTLDPAKYTNTQGKIVVDVHFNRPVGHGYMGDNAYNKGLGIIGGEYRWTNTVTVELGKVTKKPFTAYPNLGQGIAQPDPIKH